MDSDEARSVFDRESYSSALVRTTSDEAAKEFMKRIEADKRLPLRVDPEIHYYSEQTRTAVVFQVIGTFLAISMSIGAVFAAMNTMYASVGARTREIGTLRVLGYRRRTILASFIIEGAILAAIGGVLGCLASLALQSLSVYLGWQFGTMSFNTFSETVFQFRITPMLAVKGLAFSVLVGIAGSFFPAIRASRLPVISALKSV
jgi:putative ABC transport system permease protein